MTHRLAVLKPFAETSAKVVLFVCLAAAVALFAQHVLQAALFHYPLDYGEAPLVDQALRLSAGQNIYRPDLAAPPYTVSNYPPLYPLLLAALVKVFGPSFAVGRLISILSAVVTAVLLGKITSALSQDRVAALTSGAIFLAFPYVAGWSKLARVDLLALALSIAGLYVLVRRPTTWRGVIGGGLLLVAAIYTRQSYALAAPLAAFIWLWTRDRRRAVGLAALVGCLSLALFLVLNATTRGGFFYNIVTANVNEFKPDNLAWWWGKITDAAPILLLLGGLYLISGFRRVDRDTASTVTLSGLIAGSARRQDTSEESRLRKNVVPRQAWKRTSWPLLTPYLIGSALSALTVGKIGSNMNYLLELCAALSLAAGACVAWSRGRSWLRAALLLLLALQAWLLMQATQRDVVADLRGRIAQPAGAFAGLEQIVADANGPILADEFMGLLTLQNRLLYIQPFEVTQLAAAGLWDQSPLLASIRAREFPAIFVHYFRGYPVYKERWTVEMLQAIMAHYEPSAFLAETIVYRPRDPTADQPVDLEACPDSPWRLPTRSELGVWWRDRRLAFMGEGYENNAPVYAVADGLLTRDAAWHDAVAIRHDDPLQPGRQVWTFYAGLASGLGGGSFVSPSYPPGSEGVPVKQGQLLGYQGQYAAQLGTPFWPHLEFAVLPARADGSFPVDLIGPASQGQTAAVRDRHQPLDPARYLGIVGSVVTGQAAWLPLHCQSITP